MCLAFATGFSFTFMSGFCTAGAKLGAPDTGLITYSEMVDQVRCVAPASPKNEAQGNALCPCELLV